MSASKHPMVEALGLKLNQAFVALVLTFPVSLFVLQEDEVSILWVLTLSVMLDSVLGVAAAIRSKRFASWKFGQPMARKVMLYGFALTGALLASKSHSSLGFIFQYLAIYFSLSETLSIFEKLSLLGLKLPTKLLGTVNELFKRYERGDRKAEKEIITKKS